MLPAGTYWVKSRSFGPMPTMLDQEAACDDVVSDAEDWQESTQRDGGPREVHGPGRRWRAQRGTDMTTVMDKQHLARWRNAVIAAFALGGITSATVGPRMPSLRADLGVDNAVIGAMLAGVTVGAFAGLGCSALILSRLGARGGIRGALWLVALSVALIGFGAGVAHSPLIASLGFLLVGMGIGALDVMINVEGAAVEREAGRTVLPLMHAAWSAGAVIGAGVGAGCAALRIAVAWQFAGEAVLIAACAPMLTAVIPRMSPALPASKKRRRAERLRGWARGWADWRLLLIGVVMLGVELGEGSANNWLTLAVRDDHHQGEAVAALFFVVFAAAETTTRVFGGKLVDRVGRRAAIRLTTALGVIGLLLFIVASPAWLVLAGTFLWAVGVSMGFPLGMSAAAESGPDPAAQVSVVASIGYVANFVAPPAVGVLSQSFGLLNALWLLVAFLLVSFVAAGVLQGRNSGGKEHRALARLPSD
jgi:MFS family permease